uniref:Ovule protein n=1 Tax=Heterorhabditis bacteriophora TaxID=37862 RepID=A0A1I7W7I9_HETBA
MAQESMIFSEMLPHWMKKKSIQEEKAMQAVPSAPVDASKFVAYVTERRKKRILFKGEYLIHQSGLLHVHFSCNGGSNSDVMSLICRLKYLIYV